MRFLKKLFWLILLGIILANPSYATNVSGNQSGTWNLAGSPYIVTGNITIPAGQTLTIDAGVNVKFNAGFSIDAQGALLSQGTSGNEVVFTSNLSNPSAGSWDKIQIHTSSTTINFTRFEYAIAALRLVQVNITPTIQNSIFQNNDKAIYVGTGGNPAITGNTIQNNVKGIYIECDSAHCGSQIHNNQILNNTSKNLETFSFGNNARYYAINAENNWWGSADIPAIVQGIKSRDSANVGLPTVNFIPFLDGPNGNSVEGYLYGYMGSRTLTTAHSPYIVVGDVLITSQANSGSNLTINPGVEIKFDGFYSIKAEKDVVSPSPTQPEVFTGKLTVNGAFGNLVKFTSNQATPAPGDWDGLTLSNTSTLQYSIVEYAKHGIHSAAAAIQNNIIRNNSKNGIIVNQNSAATVTGNTVTNNVVGIRVEVDGNGSLANISNNAIYNNSLYNLDGQNIATSNLILITAPNNWWGTTDPFIILSKINNVITQVVFPPYLDGPGGNPIGTTITQTTLSSNATWSTTGSPYFLYQNLTVDPSATLTINPGVKVYFYGGNAIIANGILNAQGTSGNEILFSSFKLTRNSNDWGHIKLTQSGSSLTYAKIEFSNEGIKIDNASPTVHHNTLKNNTWGITLLNGASPTLTNNKILNNDQGVHIESSGTAPTNPILHDNFIYNNTSYNLAALCPSTQCASQTINAENNWWGTSTLSVINSKILDQLDFNYNPLVDVNPYSTNSGVNITATSVSPVFFSPDSGATTNINYTLDQAADVTIRIYKSPGGQLVRSLLVAQLRSSGAHAESWNGLDDASQLLSPGAYYYTIVATNTAETLYGEYDPTYTPTSVSLSGALTFTPTSFNQFAGETASVSYTLSAPASVRLRVGLSTGALASRTLIDFEPRDTGTHIENWNGRDDSGNFVTDKNLNAVYWAQTLPANLIVINPSNPFGTVSAQPYAMSPAYGDKTHLQYNITQNLTVTSKILSPSGNTDIKILENNVAKSAGTYTLDWDGTDTNGNYVDAGNYRFHLMGTDANGIQTAKDVNITVFK